jgi:hypothetical protein
MDGDLAEQMGLGSQNQPAVDTSILNADIEWDKVSRFRFHRPSSDLTQHHLYFDTKSLDDNTNAMTDFFGVSESAPFVDLSISSVIVYFNPNRPWSLQLNGYPNVWRVVVHELGHVLGLEDKPNYTWHDGGYNGGNPNPPNYGQCYTDDAGNGCKLSVMWGSNLNYPGLYTDDKEAATMQYGIYTHFEQSRFLGLHTNLRTDPRQSMGIYDNCSILEPADGFWYWAYDPRPGGTAANDGVPESPASQGASGGRFMRFRGCSRVSSLTEYAYMTLAWTDHDGPGEDLPAPCFQSYDYACAMQIKPGMKLSWWQYNKKPDTGYSTHCTAGIDLELIRFPPGGGTQTATLRDFVVPSTGQTIKDTAGIRIYLRLANRW